jgi:fructuronate reductase
VLGTIRERLRGGQSISRLAHVVAAWIRYLEGTDDRGEAIGVNDPFKEKLQTALASAGGLAEAKVAAILGFEPIFGTGLSDDDAFRKAVLGAYDAVIRCGIRDATATLAAVSSNH